MIDDPPALADAATWAGLSSEATELLRWRSARYRASEARAARASKNDRSVPSKALFNAALKLQKLLAGMPAGAREEVDGALPSLILDGQPELSYLDQSFRVARFERELVNLLTAFDVARWGGRGGRPKTSPERRQFMHDIARTLKDAGIEPSASRGKFLALCVACYKDAGIKSKGAAAGDARALCAWIKRARSHAK